MSHPEFDIEQFKERLPKFQLGGIKWIVVAGIIAAAFFTAIYTVPPESVGVVFRFGKYSGQVDRGLHVKMPFGVDRVYKVPVRRQLKAEFGFATEGGANPDQFSASLSEQEQERSMVSGDLNAALVTWVVQYRIDDAKAFLVNVRSPGKTLRAAAEAVMREVVGDRTVDEVITVGRQNMEIAAKEKLGELCQLYQLGLVIDQVQLRDVNPPRPVQASFNEVNEAQQEREQQINVARGEYNKVIPQAEGKADQSISEARGYATRRVNEAEGEATRFKAVFSEYQQAPEVTRRRIFLETMAKTLPRMGSKIVIDENARQVLPFLQLNPGAAAPAVRPTR